MSDPENILDVDFDAQMKGLFQQAELAICKRAVAGTIKSAPTLDRVPDESADAKDDPAPPPEQADSPEPPVAETPGALHPAMLGLDALSRTISESIQALPKAVADLKSLLEMKNGVSHSMFSALHEELKGYKDGFLLQSVYRPIIRDLVSLYDDLTEIHRQISEALGEAAGHAEESAVANKLIERMRMLEMNVEHNVEFILEVLARLEVTQFPVGTGKLDKCRQRAVAVEPTDNLDDDTLVVRSVKRGFLWHDRVLRPEEVVVKRYRDGARTPSLSTPTQ